MRIAVVHSYYSSSVPSGENNVVRDQVAVLREAGHQVLEVSRFTDQESARGGYAARSAVRVMTGHGTSPAEQFAHFSPDVVHLHNTFPNWSTSWLGEWGARTVATLHNYRTLCANGLLFRDGHPCQDCVSTPVLPAVRHRCYRDSAVATLPVAVAAAPGGGLRRIASRVARLVALNASAAELFEREFRREVVVVPNFVPDAPASGERGERWAYVGRFSAEKGVRELLRAWPEDEQLDLVGSGPLADELRALAAGRRNIHISDAVDRESLRTLMGTWRGLVVPSLWTEGLPTVALEALASGTPLLVSHHVAASTDLARSGAAVVFDPAASTEQLRQHLAGVRSGWDAMSTAARDLHRTSYAPDAWLARMQAVYDSV